MTDEKLQDIWKRVFPQYKGRPKIQNQTIFFHRVDNYTLCTLTTSRGWTFPGIAKRNPIDPDRPEVGEAIAFKRAADNLAAGSPAWKS